MGPNRSFPLSRRSAHDAQPDAVSTTAHELDAIPPLRDEDVSLEDIILSRLDDDKAQDIVLNDLKGKCSVADSLVVASGRSHRHVGTQTNQQQHTQKNHGYGKARVEGMPHCDWVLIDAGDVVVHIFRPEVRAGDN